MANRTCTCPNCGTSFTPIAKSKQTGPCWCGCGGTTKSRFVPGHDSRFHSRAKAVARGEADEATELARLPHDEAREEFSAWVADERPVWAAKQARLAAEKAAKEAEEPAAV